MFLIDTDVLIECLRGSETASSCSDPYLKAISLSRVSLLWKF